MTADDFYLLSIAFGSFMSLALVLWRFARFADRKQDAKRGPDIRHDVDSPGSPNGHGRKQAARSNGANDVLRRFADWAATARCRVEHLNGITGKA